MFSFTSISSFGSSILISFDFVNSSCMDFNSSSSACFLSVSSPYIGTTSSNACSIILSSLMLTAFGLNFSFSFLEISSAIVFVDSGTFSRCSFGMISMWPLLRGFSSRIAISLVSSAIL